MAEIGIDIFARIANLVAFSIVDWNINDVSPIHALSSLKYLEVATYCKSEIDFRKFSQLEECKLEWRQKARSLFQCISLRRLFVNKYRGQTISDFGKLANLELLALANSPIKSVSDIGGLQHLRSLEFHNLRKLSSLSGIDKLTNLEHLEVNGCKSIDTIEPIATLRNLTRLHLINDGYIQSLRPIRCLSKLRRGSLL